MTGHRPGRWRNVLSLVTAALAHAGIVRVQGRIREKPAPDWLAVLGLLETHQQRHFHLWRFARWASSHGVAPTQVDDELIARYRQELKTRSLVTEPARAARDAARYWNMAATTHPGWPQQRLTVPDNRKTYAVPWEAFPASLRHDVEDWATWLGTDDPFLDRDFTPLRPASVAARLRQIRIYLAALVHQGVDPQALDTLAAAVIPARAERGLRFFWEKAGRRPSHHAYHIAGLVMMIARHRARLPAADLDRLRAMADRLRPVAQGLAGRNISRLRQLEDPQRLDALLTLPARVLDSVRRAGAPSIQLARRLQIAVAIEILLCIPMRLRNLRTLRIGTHLIRGTGGTTFISIPGEEVKNGVPLEGRQAGRTLSGEIPALAGACRQRLAFPGRQGGGTQVR